ncbi:hypothetical protein BH20ACT23_BH20ACT23_13490 [soil metagenome]
MRSLSFVGRSKHGVHIEVFVQPCAARDSVEGIQGDALKLKVMAPPIDDRANKAVEKLLAACSTCLVGTSRWSGAALVGASGSPSPGFLRNKW